MNCSTTEGLLDIGALKIALRQPVEAVLSRGWGLLSRILIDELPLIRLVLAWNIVESALLLLWYVQLM